MQAHPMRRVALFSFVFAFWIAVGVAGCGGGGGGGGNTNPGGSSSTVSGSVTDIDGAPILNASVKIGTLSATTTQGGTYVIPNVIVPTGQSSLVVTVSATKVIAGANWSGQNEIQVISGQTNTSNVNLVLSNSANQGTLTGTVTDTGGAAVAFAHVTVAPGPVTDSTGAASFTNFSSFSAYTNAQGHYTIPNLPAGVSYTPSTSATGHLNSALPVMTLTAGATTRLNFTLAPSTTSPALSAVTGFAASCFTVPTTPSRAVGGFDMSRGWQAIKNYLLQQRGLAGYRSVPASRITLRSALRSAGASAARSALRSAGASAARSALRSAGASAARSALRSAGASAARSVTGRPTPAGELIETNLFWNYVQTDNLLGFDILRSPNDDTHFGSIAKEIVAVSDPLADRFSDLDPTLTPGTNYFYNIAPVDTINFPVNGDEGPTVAYSVEVDPLDIISETTPASGATVSATPTLSWSAVNNAGYYQVLIYNQFPDYQSDTEGVAPVVTPPAVNAPTTSLTLSSALSPGTYYWAVIAVYSPSSGAPAGTQFGASYSISQIGSFVVP